MQFKDRQQAGKLLAHELVNYKSRPDTLVMGLARGGIPVAYEVATALQLPLNVLVPRKVGAPYNPELAIGAVAETGEGFFNENLIRVLQVPDSYIQHEVENQKKLAKQRLTLYRKNAPLADLSGKTVILVDDGIATGATMFASINAIRHLGAGEIVVAVPVAASSTLDELKAFADQVVAVHSAYDLGAIGYYYEHFDQTADEEVIALLEKAKKND